eukprot:g1075.t1
MTKKVNKERQRKRARKKKGGTSHYLQEHSFLVLGDGDFSFAEGLMEHRRSADNICATTFDSYKTVCDKYRGAKSRIQRLRDAGMRVIFEVDARDLPGSLPEDARKFYDRVIFNFPHSGKQRVHVNRELIRRFFHSSRNVVDRKIGEVHLTLKNAMPYSSWEADKSAKAAGFCNFGSFPFDPNQFPGYSHQTTVANAETFEVNRCLTTRYLLDLSTVTPSSFGKKSSLSDPPRAKADPANSAPSFPHALHLSPSCASREVAVPETCKSEMARQQENIASVPQIPTNKSENVKCKVCGRRCKSEKSMLQHCRDKKDKEHQAWMSNFETLSNVDGVDRDRTRSDGGVDRDAQSNGKNSEGAEDDDDDNDDDDDDDGDDDDHDDHDDDDDVVIIDPSTIKLRYRKDRVARNTLSNDDTNDDTDNCFAAKSSCEESESEVFRPQAEFQLLFTSAEDNLCLKRALDMSAGADDILAESKCVPLSRKKFSCLRAGGWLNDEVVNFYLEVLQKYADRASSRIYIHSTFLYEKLVRDRGGYNYDNVRRWTRNVNLCHLDALLIPINFTDYHWAMVLVTLKDRTIWYVDSLQKSLRSREKIVLAHIERYLNDEIVDKGFAKSPLSWTRASRSGDLRWHAVPRQKNGIDCGVFACAFALCIVSRATFGFSQKDIPDLRRHIGLSLLIGALHQSWSPLRRNSFRVPSFDESDETLKGTSDECAEKYLAEKGMLVALFLQLRKLTPQCLGCDAPVSRAKQGR